jgi:hypothetical protein
VGECVWQAPLKRQTGLLTKEMREFKWQRLAAALGEWPLCDLKNWQGKNHLAIEPRGLDVLEVSPISS